MSEPEVVCGVRLAECFCGLPPDHDPPHVCRDTERCDGAWNDDGSVVRFPGVGSGVALYALMGMDW